MTVSTGQPIVTCAYRAQTYASAFEATATSARLAATPSQVRGSIASVADAGLVKHSQKLFAMAGTNTNVWPLSPQERSSG